MGNAVRLELKRLDIILRLKIYPDLRCCPGDRRCCPSLLPCKDKYVHCVSWTSLGYCASNVANMKEAAEEAAACTEKVVKIM